jgi:ATP-binding protein involved in chromosome partitioning
MTQQANKNLNNIKLALKDIIFNNGYKLIDLMSQIIVKNENDIGFSIDISNVTLEDAERVKKTAEKKLYQLEGIGKITIIFTNERTNSSDLNLKKKIIVPGKVIIVASGKGGVGKSTFSFSLAKKLASIGKSVGVADLDIYGPSIPIIAEIDNKIQIENGLMTPIESDKLKIMSIGCLVEDKDALAWRGPIISKTLHQMLFSTYWGILDYLIVDTPPGTGDVHLSLLEKYHIDGCFIVTTPDKLSVGDVKKTISLYKRFNINLLGIIENNSFFIIPETQEKLYLFGKNGADQLSRDFSIPILDRIPIILNFDAKQDFQKVISDEILKVIIKEE